MTEGFFCLLLRQSQNKKKFPSLALFSMLVSIISPCRPTLLWFDIKDFYSRLDGRLGYW